VFLGKIWRYTSNFDLKKQKNTLPRVDFNSGFSTLKKRGGKLAEKGKADYDTTFPIKKG